MQLMYGQKLQVRIESGLVQDLAILVDRAEGMLRSGTLSGFNPLGPVTLVTNGTNWITLAEATRQGFALKALQIGTYNPNAATVALLFRIDSDPAFMRKVMGGGEPIHYVDGEGWSFGSGGAGGGAVIPTDALIGSGSILIDGGGSPALATVMLSAGGSIIIDGAALVLDVVLMFPAGELVIGGGADIRTPFYLVPDGGLLIDGAAIAAFTLAPSGGVLIGGAAMWSDPWHLWTFNEGPGFGTANDTGVGPHEAWPSDNSWTNSSLDYVPGGNAYALRLEGLTGGISTPASSFTFDDDFFLCGRVRITWPGTGAPDNYNLFTWVQINGLSVDIDTLGAFSVRWNGSSVTYTIPSWPPSTAWIRWAVRRTKATNSVELLLDGAVVATGTIASDPPTGFRYDMGFTSGNSTTMDVDDLRVYGRLVDDAEYATILGSAPLGALSFDGGDNVALASSVEATPFSMSCWIQLANTSAKQPIAGGGFFCWAVYLDGSPLTLKLGRLGSSETTFAGATISDMAKHHVVITFDGSTAKCYLDGALIATNSYSFTPSSGSYQLAAYGTGGEKLIGKMADFRLYSTVISGADVTAIYNSGAPTLTDATAGYTKRVWYKMTEGSGTTLGDSSGNSNTGTFGAGAAAPTWSTF
jgi:hypothetical protein